ncbi:hypothetical protein [Bradyrhizobium elkanii]|uniref:hypothetical protein n=1 Tax=Bradyrhizobium elkanii TaxID=29448 RepID=UPI0008699F46|nr:hypothetical protein [Bradyrhizobium elkanii]ODM82230.1 hypothetical protein A6X20_17445 [Bradyrhizobium elkanii]ODM85339.1 hypothetical protein A6452_12020 [Bradyrhizobium elkanii]
MEFIGRPMRGRFLVRQGGNGWMVYDSELKGPAQIEKNGAFAEKLTKEQAETLEKLFTSCENRPLTKKAPAPGESAEAGK